MLEYLHSFSKLEFDKIIARLSSIAVTEVGKVQIQQLKPLASISDIQTALKCVSEMKMLIESNIPPPLEGVVDCSSSINFSRIDGNILSAPNIRHTGNLLVASRNLKTYLRKQENSAPLLASLSDKINADKILEFNIDSAINQQGEVLDSASKKLRRIRSRLHFMREDLRKQLHTLLQSAVKNSWAQDEIITTREGRMVIPVKVEHKQRVPGFIHSTSSSGATVFIEPAETLEMNNGIRGLMFEEEREIQQILKDLTLQIRFKADELLVSIYVIGKVDLIYANAKYSLSIMGGEARVGSGVMSLQEARHPLLIDHLGYNRVVPFNLEMGKGYHSVVISGPNAGGKSVVLKTVGLIVTMIHHGIHAPISSDSQIPFISKIFVDIGDEQSIMDNLSTFTSHLKKLQLICDEANSTSLVLVDEICAGTDPSEGGALAVAILKRLTYQKSLNVVTTHNSAVKAFAVGSDGMLNASMEFDQSTLAPTYNLRVGVIGSSYALEIAKRLNVSESILSDARSALGAGTHKISSLLSYLEKEREILQNQLEVLRKKELHLNELIGQYETKLSKFNNEVNVIKKTALEEAKEVIRQSHSTIEKAIREIKEERANNEVVRKTKKEIQQENQRLHNLETELAARDSQKNKTEVVVGQLVRLKGGNTFGEIVEIIDKDYVLILSRNLKFKIGKKELVHVNSTISSYPSKLNYSIDVVPNHQVDVRGMYRDEAIAAIDKSLDNAILLGQLQVKIIHGKGTGALQKKIHIFLSHHPQVKSFRLGEWNEGGSGTTMVNLK
jgi:DNA mismatch repair protein MutS2